MTTTRSCTTLVAMCETTLARKEPLPTQPSARLLLRKRCEPQPLLDTKRTKAVKVEVTEDIEKELLRTMPRPEKEVDLRHRMSVTEIASVSGRTQVKYGRLLKDFMQRTGLRRASLTANQLDIELIGYFDRLYFEGRDPSAGQKLAASVLFHFPVLMGTSGQD